MKKSYSFFLSFFIFVFSLSALAQDENSRYEKIKEWKLNFILDNLELTPEEEEHFHCIFNTYEDDYHSRVWIKERQIKKQVEEIINSQSIGLSKKFLQTMVCVVNK